MRNPLKRHYGQGDLHFITFSCYHRQPLLGSSESRDTFVKILDEIRLRHGFQLFGYVVMPEHVHLLLNESKSIDPSKVLQVLKQRVSVTCTNWNKYPGDVSLKEQIWMRFDRSGSTISIFGASRK